MISYLKASFTGLLLLVGSATFAQQKTTTQQASLGIQELRSGGSVGVSLRGEGIPVGVFEADAGGGSFLSDSTLSDLSHIQNTESGNISGHATTVVKILTSKGVTTPSEEGVAPDASVYVYGLNSTHQTIGQQLGDAIRGRNLLVSNHSHSQNHGWNAAGNFWSGVIDISETEDYKFGYYGNLSRTFDSICAEHPYHTLVKAIGNERKEVHVATPFSVYNYDAGSFSILSRSIPIPEDDGGADGYDCLSRDNVSKNALVVGAADNISGGYSTYTDISFANSSSAYGPADDARIKPDLVAPGQLTSGTSFTSYSAPTVSGLVALLQELHMDEYGRWMRSSTVKALLIQTADPATANSSPNASAGWGMPNAVNAARHVLNADGEQRIVESEIENGETVTFRFYHDGTTDFRATLAWIDPMGSTPSLQYDATDLDDSTAILVNDLNLELWQETGTPSLAAQPWKLSAANPGNSAWRGDNEVDNVERIDWPSASMSAGWYTLRVSHDGTLANPQEFSLLITDARGITFQSGAWSTAPSAWDDYVFIHIQDTTAIARISENVTVSYLLINAGGDLHINEANSVTVTGEAFLRANVNGTALIKGPLMGTVTRQSYVSGSEGWRFLHSPVKNTVEHWGEQFTRMRYSGSSSPSVYRWDAANTQWNALGSADSVHHQGGVSMYMGTNSYAQFTQLPYIISMRGNLDDRHKSLTLTVDDDSDASDDDLGWNLVGHPYLAPIAWASINRTQIGTSFYVWNDAQSDFASSDGTVAIGGGSNFIMPGQSVWNYCANGKSGALTWDTAAVALNRDLPILKHTQPLLRMKLLMTDSLYEEVVMVFQDDADTAFDPSLDVLMRQGGDPQRSEMYWQASGKSIVINRASLKKPGFAGLRIEPGQLGFNAMQVELKNSASEAFFWLHDSNRYPLESVPAEVWALGGDFELHWSENLDLPDLLLSNFLYYAEGALHWQGRFNTEIELISIDGVVVLREHISGESIMPVPLEAGVYIARCLDGSTLKFFHRES